jgi:hypothetical protein
MELVVGRTYMLDFSKYSAYSLERDLDGLQLKEKVRVKVISSEGYPPLTHLLEFPTKFQDTLGLHTGDAKVQGGGRVQVDGTKRYWFITLAGAQQMEPVDDAPLLLPRLAEVVGRRNDGQS